MKLLILLSLLVYVLSLRVQQSNRAFAHSNPLPQDYSTSPVHNYANTTDRFRPVTMKDAQHNQYFETTPLVRKRNDNILLKQTRGVPAL